MTRSIRTRREREREIWRDNHSKRNSIGKIRRNFEEFPSSQSIGRGSRSDFPRQIKFSESQDTAGPSMRAFLAINHNQSRLHRHSIPIAYPFPSQLFPFPIFHISLFHRAPNCSSFEESSTSSTFFLSLFLRGKSQDSSRSSVGQRREK